MIGSAERAVTCLSCCIFIYAHLSASSTWLRPMLHLEYVLLVVSATEALTTARSVDVLVSM
jgi:hypothetical protein